MMKRTLVNINRSKNHFKVYQLARKGRVVTMSWGRIGATLQTKKQSFPSIKDAQLFVEKKMTEKSGTGYSVVPAAKWYELKAVAA
jgi:predicted DNA-binding WGR domain protein